MSWKKTIGWIARILMVLYAAQILLVSYWENFPMEERQGDGNRYEIKRGFGFPFALIPLVGVFPIVGNEPVHLVTTDLASEKRTTKNYDLPMDIYRDHPKIWPEKQWVDRMNSMGN